MEKQKKRRFGDGTPGPGRPKGSRDKRNRVTGLVLDGEKLEGDELIRALFRVVRDKNATRDEVTRAAAAGLPYYLPKLSSIELASSKDKPPVRIRLVIEDEKKPDSEAK